MLRKRKGQSTLEYITVFVAIVAAILLIAYSALGPAVTNLFNGVGNKISQAASTFQSANLGTQ